MLIWSKNIYNVAPEMLLGATFKSNVRYKTAHEIFMSAPMQATDMLVQSSV